MRYRNINYLGSTGEPEVVLMLDRHKTDLSEGGQPTLIFTLYLYTLSPFAKPEFL